MKISNTDLIMFGSIGLFIANYMLAVFATFGLLNQIAEEKECIYFFLLFNIPFLAPILVGSLGFI